SDSPRSLSPRSRPAAPPRLSSRRARFASDTMAMTLPGRGRGRFGPALSDINVTPLVDVILVLLIIFMVTAPMMTRGIDVRLPKTESGSDATDQRLVVTVATDNTIYLNERPVNLALPTAR